MQGNYLGIRTQVFELIRLCDEYQLQPSIASEPPLPLPPLLPPPPLPPLRKFDTSVQTQHIKRTCLFGRKCASLQGVQQMRAFIATMLPTWRRLPPTARCSKA